jgi:hypothetical protein
MRNQGRVPSVGGLVVARATMASLTTSRKHLNLAVRNWPTKYETMQVADRYGAAPSTVLDSEDPERWKDW